jgi:signal peptidase II
MPSNQTNSESSNSPQMPATVLASGIWWGWLSVIALVLDQATKIWALNTIELGGRIEILPVFNLTHVHNYGAAFSFLADAGGWQRSFLTILAIGISIMLLWWMRQTPKSNKLLGMSYSLILGGAIGNVIDRVVYCYVEDFIHVFYQNWHFPAFNIADSAITLGAILLIVEAFKGESSDNSSDKNSEANPS